MNALRQPWGLIRILRLVIGSIVIYQSVGEQQPILGLLGAFFVIQALMNTGCGATGCQIPRSTSKKTLKTEVIDYEDVNQV
ncbi:hypothetical protein [Spirosoma spitsbergense]|uniref:hypothetical protein n=1 Tax=Spirosoma spitsbergense TaxID=431554 RepID=UPI00036FB1E3|nr:hypothetical protein [Spirosoma spitsbergense]